MTTAWLALLEAFLRLGCSILTSSSAMRADHTIRRGPRATVRRAGVVKLVDTPALGAGGASRGGSSPSARIVKGFGMTPLLADAIVGRPGRDHIVGDRMALHGDVMTSSAAGDEHRSRALHGRGRRRVTPGTRS